MRGIGDNRMKTMADESFFYYYYYYLFIFFLLKIGQNE